jgi:hypothetical protein
MLNKAREKQRMKNIKSLILNIKYSNGLTLVELMVTILIATLVFAGIGVLMVDSIKGFGKMYERTEGNYQRQDITAGVIPDSYVARAAFDRICRQASAKMGSLDTDKHGVKVFYYSNPSNLTLKVPDKCAYFRWNGGTNPLTVSYGDGSGGNLGTAVNLANNVTACNFDIQGSSVVMALTIDNSGDTNAKQAIQMTVTSAAKRHNDPNI